MYIMAAVLLTLVGLAYGMDWLRKRLVGMFTG